jgi:membrane-associated phospholipid phosphatase
VRFSSIQRRLLFLAIWASLLVLAFAVDRSVAQWVHATTPLNQLHIGNFARRVIRLPGYYPFTLFVAFLLACFHPNRWVGAIALALSGATVGLIGNLVKWTAGRHRPIIVIAPFDFHPFPQSFWGLFTERGLSFPSGDTILAFASAASLCVLLRRGRWAIYFWAILVAAERVLENAHYISDVVAAAGIGIIVGDLMTRRLLSLFAGGRGDPSDPLPAQQEPLDPLNIKLP